MLRSSGTWVASNSATPPPYAVALRWSTRAPCRGLASVCDAVDDVAADDVAVVVDVFFEEGNTLEHGLPVLSCSRGGA